MAALTAAVDVAFAQAEKDARRKRVLDRPSPAIDETGASEPKNPRAADDAANGTNPTSNSTSGETLSSDSMSTLELAQTLWKQDFKPRQDTNGRVNKSLKMSALDRPKRAYIERLPGFQGYGFVNNKLRILISSEALTGQPGLSDEVKAKLGDKIEVIIAEGYEVEARHVAGRFIVEKEEISPGPLSTDSNAVQDQSTASVSSVTCTLLALNLQSEVPNPYPYVCTCAHTSKCVQEHMDESSGLRDVHAQFYCSGGATICKVCIVDENRMLNRDNSITAKVCVAMRQAGSESVHETRDILCVPQSNKAKRMLKLMADGYLKPVEVFEDTNPEDLVDERVYIVTPNSSTPIPARIVAVNQSRNVAVKAHGLLGESKRYVFDGLYQLSAEGRVGEPGESGSGVFIIKDQGEVDCKPMLLAMICATELTPQPQSVRSSPCTVFALSFADNIREITGMQHVAYIPKTIHTDFMLNGR